MYSSKSGAAETKLMVTSSTERAGIERRWDEEVAGGKMREASQGRV